MKQKTSVIIIKYLFIILVAATFVGTAVGGIVVLYFSRSLPSIITIDDYKPAAVTKVLGKNDALVGEFFEERRYVVSMEKIPEMVSRAFISAEDDRFFEHQGIDLQGILRASIANFRAGRVVQGGSTITQQVAKSLLLTPERSFVRKIKEVILASKMEKNLTKKQILYLYLNQIYLGQGAYGVEAAARIYFNKEAKDLTVAEAAILGGLPQAPSKYSPLQNPKKAKERQLYVLRRMHEDGVITKAQLDQATSEQIKIYLPKDINKEIAPYYVEHIRKYVLDKYGKDQLYQGGLTIKSPVDAELSKVAMKAVQEGLRNVDKRQGYRGPLRKNKTQGDIDEAIEEATEYNITKVYPYQVLQADGTHAKDPKKRIPVGMSEIEIYSEGEIYKAVVERVDDAKKETIVSFAGLKGVIPLDKMKWAQLVKTPSSTGVDPISKPSQAFDRGDLIWVRLISKELKTQSPILALEQTPEVQGALLAMDTSTGEIQAMVGGYSFEGSEFNRATQAARQPGSSYKPVIYSAALDKGYTPATVIQDSPIVLEGIDNQKWKPENYEEKFYGDTTFRASLIRSRNIPTIKIVQDIQIPYLIEYSKRLGVTGNLNNDLSIALGSNSMSLLDVVKVYSVYARLGRKVKEIFIHKITDREGKILEENIPVPNVMPLDKMLGPPPKPIKVCGDLQTELSATSVNQSNPNITTNVVEATQTLKRGEFVGDPKDPDIVLDPRTAYVMTHIMNEVTTMGTGAEAKNLGRPAAGKTGTTNDYIDAWFTGFTANVVTGVWVGFDSQRTIAPKATGASCALPIWMDYMKEANKSFPIADFPVPKGVTFVTIDNKSGKRVNPKAPNSVLEAFVEGTEPGGALYSSGSVNTSSASSSQGASPVRTKPKANDNDAESSDFLKEDL